MLEQSTCPPHPPAALLPAHQGRSSQCCQLGVRTVKSVCMLSCPVCFSAVWWLNQLLSGYFQSVCLSVCVCTPGVWKGLVARIIMIGTLTALQWFIYDSVKVYFRLPRPPPPEMPESLKKKLGLTD